MGKDSRGEADEGERMRERGRGREDEGESTAVRAVV